MKNFFYLTLAATIIAFVVFAIMYWLVGWNFTDSKITAVTVGVTGIIVEYLRPAITRWSKRFDITAHRKHARR